MNIWRDFSKTIFSKLQQNGETNDIYMFDIVNMNWILPHVSGSPPSPRESFSMNLVKSSSIFIFGGYSVDGT
jgi:hypothetical protein